MLSALGLLKVCVAQRLTAVTIPCMVGHSNFDQSGLAPENLTTLPHFSVSSATSLPKSAAEPGSSDAPRSANRACALGSARIALTSLLSFSMISAGVPFGTPMPYHALDS